MDALFQSSGDRRWDLFVDLNDHARFTLRLSDAARAGFAYRAWCLGEDCPVVPLTEQQLALWRQVVEWAGALRRGVPDASTELCVARGRFVHSFAAKKGSRNGQGKTEAVKATQGREGLLERGEGAES